MRKAFVLVATFAAVLIAGAAFAYMATPSGDVADAGEEFVEEPTTTSTLHEEERKLPPFEEEPEEVVEKEEPKEDPPKAEEEPKPDIRPPEIVILHPENGTHTTDGEIAYEGEAEPGSRVYVGDREIEVGDDGHWGVVLGLEFGANYRVFVAVDEAGHESAADIKVWRDQKEEPKEEEEEKPKEHEFTVHQKYGSCSEPVPYDKWYGTGEPGTKIWIGNDYGEGYTEIGESGEWFLKVFFPEAPCNTQITAVLETNKGHRQVFEFTRICEEEPHEEPPPEEQK